MKVIADVCIIPVGTGTSVSAEVARCQQIFSQHKLAFQMHAFGTNIEGDWDQVMAAIKDCHTTLHREGVLRISTTLKLGTRTDKVQTLAGKMKSVAEKLP